MNLDHYTDDYIRVCKDNQIEPFFSVSLYIVIDFYIKNGGKKDVTVIVPAKNEKNVDE